MSAIGTPDESPVEHLNNARQILSSLHELLPPGELRTFIVAAGRRVARAVELLAPRAVNTCRACATPLVDVGRDMLRCVWCGQLERPDGTIVIAGEPGSFDTAELGRGELELLAADPLDEDPSRANVEQLLEAQRDRYHQLLEQPSTLAEFEL